MKRQSDRPGFWGVLLFVNGPGYVMGNMGRLLRCFFEKHCASSRQVRARSVSRISHDSACGRGISGMTRSVPECWARRERNTDADGRLHPMAIYGELRLLLSTTNGAPARIDSLPAGRGR